eukprot:491856_1
MSALDTFKWVALIFYILVATPFFIYCFYKTWLNRNELFIQKRYYQQLYVTLIFLFLLVSRNVLANPNICFITTICNIEYQWQLMIEMFIVLPMVITFTSRVWFLYYDLKWNQIISNIDWWKHVNIKQIYSCSNNWIIKHKTTLGSFNNYMYKYLCLSFIIYMIVAIIVCVTSGRYVLYFLDIFTV